jgi:heme/copper-type cytochrome/quinol oxidase subunit 2
MNTPEDQTIGEAIQNIPNIKMSTVDGAMMKIGMLIVIGWIVSLIATYAVWKWHSRKFDRDWKNDPFFKR